MSNSIEQVIFNDLAQIEKTLTEDKSGERARSMLSYFDDAVRSAEGDVKSIPDAERQMNLQLVAGFRASQRIIRHVWETVHSTSLPA